MCSIRRRPIKKDFAIPTGSFACAQFYYIVKQKQKHFIIYLLLPLLLHSVYCVFYFSTIFGVGALASSTLRFFFFSLLLFLSALIVEKKIKNETLTEKLHIREHKHQHWTKSKSCAIVLIELFRGVCVCFSCRRSERE